MARVLVIEDNPASLDLMVYLLKAFGHAPLLARDGLQGIEVARTERPDLILCDIQLPGADGIQVCGELKKDLMLNHIPLVAVTAYAMVGDRERLLAHGFDGYLSKPINPQTFMDQLAPYLRTINAAVLHGTTPTVARAAGSKNCTILVVDNSPVNISLSRSVLEPFGYTVIEARGVDEAMKLLKDEKPDLILSDLHMPRKDGFDLIQEVKRKEELRDIPFVFISSTVWADSERTLGLSLGGVEFIIRPIAPQELVARIESCLHKAGANGKL
jgi:two-component system, cell cycle response regulator